MGDIDRRSMMVLGAGAAATWTGAAAAGRSSRSGPVDQLAARQPVVEIASGRIRGVERSGVRVFLGIPYGRSTAGKRRFMPPLAVEPWQGVRDTLSFGPQCPVTPASSLDAPMVENSEDAFVLYRGFLPHISHEDCLRLNVWAPAGEGRRPVMVFMHGGGFVAGSGHDLLAYDGENLARRGDVVVVTHNHRLNAFGYLDLSTFGGKWANSANVGMQDIVAVLQWVRTNAAALGGDPDNVTIFGQSGGGGKVQALMAMPSAKGLFHKAIVQSGAIPGFGHMSRLEGRELAETILAELGVGSQDLERLAELPADRLCASATSGGRAFRWGPVVDGSVVVAAPGSDSVLAPGVPLLVGTVLNELMNPVGDPKAAAFDAAALNAAAQNRYGEHAAAVVAAYRRAHPDRAPIELWYAMQASGIRAASYDLAARKFAQDGLAWQYLFTWATPVLEGRPKTFHSAEIAFVFDNAALCVNQTGGGEDACALAGRMSDSWISFARHGRPGHRAIPPWPAFDATRPVMTFDSSCRVVPDCEGSALRLMASLPDGRR